MSRLTIDTGTAGNPATGDSLRTAFTKVNTNFEELYAELGADGSLSDLNFTDNIISTDNTNQNIILSPNGTGLIDVDNRRIINVADPTSAQDAATKAYVDAQNVAQAITFVGDDSTGTAVNSGETFKIAGSGSVTTAVSGDTITITGATTNLGDFTFSGNKLSTTSSNADMELDTAGTGNLVLKSGNFLPATDNTQYLGSADKRWHTLYVGPGSINVNGVSITESGGKISLGNSTSISGTLEVNEITSADSSAIQINDGVNISGALTANVINIGNMVIGTVPGDITADADTGINFNVSGPDGGFVVGYLKEVGNNNTSGGELAFSSETGNATYRISLSDDLGDGFATKIWRFDGSGTITFPDSTTQNTAAKITVVGDDSTGVTLNAGETIKIAGTQNITTAVSGDTLTITGPDLSSYLTAVPKTIDVNEISSGDSSAIQINDAVNVSGAGTFHGSVRFNAGYTEKINALTSSSTITVNCATASIHTVTLAVSTGFVISNLPTGGTVTLIITQGGSGSYTATFGTDGSTTVKFPGGSPTLSTAVGAIDVVTIFNDGTNYLGNIAKAYA